MHKATCSAKQRYAGREGVVQHTKMLLRESTKAGETCGRGWIYAGSHNLSTSAWGSVDLLERGRKKKAKDAPSKDAKAKVPLVTKTNRVNHYELGVLLIDVLIKKYDSVIPWDRSTTEAMESMRYDNSKDEPFRHRR